MNKIILDTEMEVYLYKINLFCFNAISEYCCYKLSGEKR